MNKHNRQRLFPLSVDIKNRSVNVSNGSPLFSFSISGLSFTSYFTHILYGFIPFFFSHHFFTFDNFLVAYFWLLFFVSYFGMFICYLPILIFENVQIGMSCHSLLSIVSSNYSHFARFLHHFSSY
jgi:hypothetical protein